MLTQRHLQRARLTARPLSPPHPGSRGAAPSPTAGGSRASVDTAGRLPAAGPRHARPPPACAPRPILPAGRVRFLLAVAPSRLENVLQDASSPWTGPLQPTPFRLVSPFILDAGLSLEAWPRPGGWPSASRSPLSLSGTCLPHGRFQRGPLVQGSVQFCFDLSGR